jgi:hypothetical protein
MAPAATIEVTAQRHLSTLARQRNLAVSQLPHEDRLRLLGVPPALDRARARFGKRLATFEDVENAAQAAASVKVNDLARALLSIESVAMRPLGERGFDFHIRHS